MILILNSAGYLTDVESFYAGKSDREIELKQKKLFADISFMVPTTTGIITAFLRQAGFPVVHRDLFSGVTLHLSRQLAKADFIDWIGRDEKTPVMEEYLELCFREMPQDMEQIDLIGMSVRSYVQYPYALALAKECHVRYPRVPICLGGSYITLARHEFPAYITYVVKGDGGTPVCHLAAHILNKEPLDENCPGLYKLGPDGMPGREKNQDPPDDEVLPDFSGIDLDRYLNYYFHPPFLAAVPRPARPYLSLDYRTTMGCSNRCSFCTLCKVDSLRFKSTDRVLDDLEKLAAAYGDDKLYVVFSDSSFNNSPAHVNALLDGMAARKIEAEWIAYAKVHNMTEGLLEKFKENGCRMLFWGIEAAGQKMIDFYNKRFKVEEGERMLNKAIELEIVNVVSLIYNGPHETDADFDELLRYLMKYASHKPYFIPNLCEFTLEENSDIYLNPDKYGIEILGSQSDPFSTVRPCAQWKEKGGDPEALKQKHRVRKQMLETYSEQFWESSYNL